MTLHAIARHRPSWFKRRFGTIMILLGLGTVTSAIVWYGIDHRWVFSVWILFITLFVALLVIAAIRNPGS